MRETTKKSLGEKEMDTGQKNFIPQAEMKKV